MEQEQKVATLDTLLRQAFPAGEANDSDTILDQLGFNLCVVCNEYGLGLQECNACSEHICNDDIEEHIQDETGLTP